MKADEWLAAYSKKIGIEAPDPHLVEALLDLAGVAAHNSERTAAPIACYLAGMAGLRIETALDAARQVADPGGDRDE